MAVTPQSPERFAIRLRIPSWSVSTSLSVGGQAFPAKAGTYTAIDRVWSPGDQIKLELDMRCRLIAGTHGSNRDGDNRQALVRGPIVLARDENIDADYEKPVTIRAKDGYADVIPVQPTQKSTRMQFRVHTEDGFIEMVDYASVDRTASMYAPGYQ